ncbi:uncharacterized protein rab44 isoform X2 [Paralichthys olivaceus]|uniref:uncharacterized protein rab44 isoform X2 n=1 Tax=Paralichthys olivaceus TaxID=8255 RepID=UPI003751B13F
MSAQRTKQSLDSHHSVVNQSETPSVDEFYVTDNTNVPKPEGDKEPLSVLSSPHNSQPETQHLTTANRRKLGSRRRNKQQQHVKDSATELHHKHRQELKESTSGNEDLEITQSEGQEELNSQGLNSSVKHDSSLCSSTTSGYSCEVQDISGNQQADKDEKPSYSYGLVETMLEVTGASAILKSEEVKENIASGSDLISSLSVRENEKRRVEDTDLSRQDGNVEGNCLKGESHVESADTGCSMTPEVTTDKNSPRLYTELADDNQNEHLSLPLDSQLQDSSASTKERTDTDLISVNRKKLGSTRRNKRRQHVKDSAAESEEQPVENVGGFDAFETAIFPSLTETEVKSVETTLERMNRPDTDEIEGKEVAHVVGVSGLNSSDFLPTPSVSEPVKNQSDVREMPHELSSVYSVTNAEGKERDEDTDLLMQWGSLQASEFVNEAHVKSDYLECPKLETSTDKDHGEHTEPKCCVQLAIDSSPNEEVSTNEEQNEHFSLSEVRGAKNLYEEAVEPAEMQEIHLIDHSFESANSEICFVNLTDQAEVSESSQSDSSVKGVADSATEQEVSKPDHKQDEHPEKQSNVEAFKQKDDQVYDPENPETSDIERLDTAVGQVFENERQLEEDIKPSKEQTSHQEKEGRPTDVTESKSPLETTESETHAPFDSQPQDTSVIMDDQSNTDFNPISNRRKMGSRRRNKRQKSVESPGVQSEMSLMPESEVQVGISMQMMLEGMDEVGPSQTEEVCDGNNESAQSSNSGLTSVNVHSSPSVEIQVTEQPNSPASTYSAETDTESKEKDEDTDLLTRWGILQPLNSVNDTHIKPNSVESSGKPEITTEKSEYREHTEPKFGDERAAVSSPKEEMSTMEGQSEYFSSFEEREARRSEDAAEEVHEEEVKPIHMQTMHHIDNSPVEETKPCLQTLESETKLHLDSQPVDNSVSINEETHSDFKLTGNRRKLGSSRRLKGRRHGPEITEPEEEVVENTQSDEVSEKEKMPIATGTISQEELKEQTSPDLKLIKKIKSAVEEQENTEQMPDEGTKLLQNLTDNRTTVTTDILESTDEVNEAEKKFMKEPEYLTPLPVYDVVKMELIQSVEASVWKDNPDSQNISNHEGNVSTQSVPSDGLDQEETSQIHKTESLPCDKDSVGQEICVQQTTNVNESEVDVVVIEAESLMGAHGSGEVDVEDELKDPANKDLSAEETNTLIEVTHDEPFSVAQNKMEALEMGHEENSRAKPDEKSGISTSAGTSNSRGQKDNNNKTETRHMDEDAINTDSGVIEATQNEKQSPEGIKVGLIQDQPLESIEAPSVLVADQEMEESVIQEPNNAPEEAHKTNFEMRDSSPHVSSPNRRRKMGSTRRNLGSRHKLENSHQKQTHVKPDSVESSDKPEITTEKSEYRGHTEPKYGDEQAAVSSPKEEVSTTEGQSEYFSSFEDRSARDVHEEEVKLIHMQTMHHIDNSPVEETKPCLQTLESETKLHLDSQPVDNSVSINEETHSDFKLTGNRRKLGSSRRLKGRRHGPEITEPEEEVVENTQSDEVSEKEKMPIATGTISQEELKEQTSPDLKLIKKIKSAVEEQENTEQMPDEGTKLLQNLTDNRTTVTTDILESTDEVNEAEKKFMKEPEYLTPLPVYDVVKMELIQSVEASVWKDNPDSQNISNHEGNVSTQSVPSDGLDQEETSQIHKTESLPCDKDSVGQEICVQQTTNVNESEVDVVVIEAESLMGAHGSGEVDVEDELKDPANKDLSAEETNTLIEVTHDEPFSVAQNKMEALEMGHEENSRAKPDEKSGISTSAGTSNSRGQKDNNNKTETRHMDEDAINTDSGVIEATQNEKQSPEGIKVGLIQDQPLESIEAPSVLVADQEMEESVIQEPNNAPEEAHKTNFEMRDSSPHVSSPNRRRKMGSTRRNLGSRHKLENSHQKQTHVKPDSVESSDKPEITTEKSEYRGHTEPKYGDEQAAVSSPKEEVSTTEGQSEYFSSFEDRSARDVHEEEVKLIHMQTMHHIDNSPVEETKPCLQTLESETKLHLDSQPVDNSVSINEETHSDFKLTGNRRKLGSSRRLKGRRHGPEITEPEEEVVENTQSDEVSEKEKMPIATGTISQEELKEQTSPDLKLIKKIKSAVEEQENTEQMPDEGTKLLQNLTDNRTTVTTDILESTDEVNEAEKKFMKEPEYLTPLPVYDVVKMELIQSVEASVWKDNPDSQNISNHEGNVSTQSVPSDGLDQEETSQIHKTESLPCDKDSVGQEICVQQTTNVNESEVDAVVIEAESLMGAHGSGEVDVEDELKDPANKDLSAEETNTLIEVTHDEPFSVAQNKMEALEMGHEENSRAKPDEKSGISTSAGTSNSRGQKDNNNKTETRHMDEDAINTDSGVIEATQNEKQSPEGIKVGLIQDQPLESIEAPSVLVADQEMEESVIQEPNNAPEEAHKTNFEMRDSSPHVSSPNRRRKMGSTRRNLGSRHKLENSHQKQTHVKPDSVESSDKPEITTEKSEYRGHTEPKYGDEQAAVSSPKEEVSTTEGQSEYFSSFEDRSARDVHEEEVKLIHMQTMHHIDNSPVEETKPCLQTLESETKLHLDSQPVDNSVSINEETHSDFKLTGNRRKLGSSRRLKGRRHGPEITEPEEEVVENTQSDEVSEKEKMPIATGTISQEELKEQTSPDLKLIKKIKSAVGDSGVIEATQNEKQSPEGIKVGLIQDQPLESVEAPSVLVADQEMEESVIQEPNNAPEEAHKTNFEMKDSSPHVSSPNRRRKMGSTRRNLGSRHKLENSHQKQEEDKEDFNVESVSVIVEKEPPIIDQQENSDSEQREEKMFETVELSHTGEFQLKPLAQQTVEENPDSLSQQAETEHHLTPDYLPAKLSPPHKQDVMSESAAGGRRRKMGSHRKSHGHQKNEDRMISAQKERDVRSLTDESVNKTSQEEREESLGLNEKSEVEESVKTLSSNISVSNAPELSRPLSGKAPEREKPVQQHYTEFPPRQEGQNTFSLGDSRGADIRSKSYNVLLVGNSSVGKTSLMKRARSGKFSYDVPASVGLDYCMWTVVVDGKPVVLQLWDTAGQERFHSITRQVFHKAQAFLLMYDITSSQSFSAISYWANCIQEGATGDVTILLLGNKSDCGERKVKTEEGEILAKEYNFEFMECSAATGENVIHSLETVARMLSEKHDTSEQTVELHIKPPQRTRSGCC